MASPSNSELQSTYDIFLSFRGEDTRKKFTDHLYKALKVANFHTFRDEEEIRMGEFIKPELEKAIMNSRMSVIVLSQNYAESTACLFELQLILERWRTQDHFVLPVFYEVDPQEIKEQAQNLEFVGKKVTVEKVEGWRAALTNVARMKGMVSQNQCDGYEAKFIEEIVGEVKSKLGGKHLRFVDHQVSTDSRTKRLKIVDHQELDESVQNLVKKVEYLSGQENDINAEISSGLSQPGMTTKKEVEVWLRDVQQLKDDVQRLEQKVVGEMNLSSRALLGKHIVEKIQEVTELQEKGRAFYGNLLVNAFPIGRLLIPPTKDFVESTKARNTENVWKCLMNEEVRQIGVYGMGGVGKTTIMKHIHNQLLEEKDRFDNVFWVTVSKAFNTKQLQSDIAGALRLSLWDEDETMRASTLYTALSQTKKYVLILDDIWEAFPLERVGIPEPTRSTGCKIVLTTRSLDVCRRMDCTTVKVELLTEQEALTLFLSKASGHDTVLAPKEKQIAAEIAKECAGLPLAIVTVAGSLRGCKDTHEWRNALNELTNSMKDVSGTGSEVLEQLKFSYSRLGDKVLQDCFLYCSLYPENHNILVNGLIEHWIAEGLIGEMNSVEAKFDKGHVIVGKLTSTCLLESSINRDGEECLGMHDLIRDMAVRITTTSPRFMVKTRERLLSMPYEDWSEDLDKISFMYCTIEELPTRPPVCPRLTTLLIRCCSIKNFPDSFFTNMPRLKVLDLSSNNKRGRLPESISNLENLHALILEDFYLVRSLWFLKNLKALKVFILTQSGISAVPEGIQELVDLRKLDLSNNIYLRRFPICKLRKLSKLQYLRLDGTRVEVSAEDILCLRQLKIVAVLFHNVQELTKYVTSEQCQGLEKYRLIVGQTSHTREPVVGKEVHISFQSKAFGSGVDQLVLPVDMDIFYLREIHNVINLSAIPSLKDSRNLRKCVVRDCDSLESIFSLSSLSEDGQICLSTVESIDLSFLHSYRVLFEGIVPPHSIYSNLKELSFMGCHNMKNVFPVQFFQNFPNLKTLDVWDCRNVEDIIVKKEEMSNWDRHPDDIETINLPRLQTLKLGGLPRLKNIYNGMMVCQSVEKLIVANCPMVRRLPLSLHMNSQQPRAPPALKYIEGDEEWWESLEWDDPLTKIILQPFLNRDLHKERDEYIRSTLRKFKKF